jgi:hypothetical protein
LPLPPTASSIEMSCSSGPGPLAVCKVDDQALAGIALAHPVVSGAAVEDVDAWAADEAVVAAPAEKHVVTRAAGESVAKRPDPKSTSSALVPVSFFGSAAE